MRWLLAARGISAKIDAGDLVFPGQTSSTYSCTGFNLEAFGVEP